MKISDHFSRAALATTLVATAALFSPHNGWGQADMKNMPGMSPSATPTPKKSPPATMSEKEMQNMPGMAPTSKSGADSPTPTSAPGSATTKPQTDMSSMPGMSPSNKIAPTQSGMTDMQGMDHGNTSKTKAMAGMPGMGEPNASATKAMGGMPGMNHTGSSAPITMSKPGVTVLRPPQKWVPPPSDNRAAELLSRPALEQFMRPLPPPIDDTMLHSFALFDLLEYRTNSSGPNSISWDFVGWFGGDFNRLWVKSEGNQDLSAGSRGIGDLQLLYGRTIAPFWDFQIGVRSKLNLGQGLANNSRSYAVIGLQGLAPGNFDVEPAIYISERGEVSAELTLSADLYLTQRLILQPRFQGEISFQGDDRFRTGEGVTETDLGIRLRYEFRREIAPYIGVSWLRNYGETARLAEQEGESSDKIAFVAGLRLWW
jgi:copper resistance protein B